MRWRWGERGLSVPASQLFFGISKIDVVERPITLLPTLIRRLLLRIVMQDAMKELIRLDLLKSIGRCIWTTQRCT